MRTRPQITKHDKLFKKKKKVRIICFHSAVTTEQMFTKCLVTCDAFYPRGYLLTCHRNQLPPQTGRI